MVDAIRRFGICRANRNQQPATRHAKDGFILRNRTLGRVQLRGFERLYSGAYEKRIELLEASVVNKSFESPSDYSLDDSLLMRGRVAKRPLPQYKPHPS